MGKDTRDNSGLQPGKGDVLRKGETDCYDVGLVCNGRIIFKHKLLKWIELAPRFGHAGDRRGIGLRV